MSHCWANSFGELVAAAAQGAPMNRFVWICALANRQWAGNFADIDFKSMVERCLGVVVANPVPAGRISTDFMRSSDVAKAYLATSEGKKAWSSLSVSRIWCIGEVTHLSPFSHRLILTILTYCCHSEHIQQFHIYFFLTFPPNYPRCFLLVLYLSYYLQSPPAPFS